MFFLFFLTIFSSLLGKSLKTDVNSQAAILMNAETGAILYAKDIHEKMYPASITKIATALYVLEKKGHQLQQNVTANSAAILTVPTHVKNGENSSHPSYRLEIGGSNIGLRSGETISLNSLLYGLLLSSGNDAANVLAETTSGSIEQFMKELNAFLKHNKISQTQFTNPHGLHHSAHWTTAYDMALITQLALKNSTFREIVRTPQYLRPKTNKQPAVYFVQGNRLLKSGPYYYSKAIGVKTGHTSLAGFTFVGAATHEGRTLIAVLLNSPTSEGRFKDAIKLFEAAFAEKLVCRTLFAKEKEQFTRDLREAKSPLHAELKEDLVLKYYPAEEPSFRAEIRWNKIFLPITKDTVVGNLCLVNHEEKIFHQLPLYAAHSVEKKMNYKILILGAFLFLCNGTLLFYFLKKKNKIV